MPANGPVAEGAAYATPRWRATPAERLWALGYDATGPCQSSGTLRTALAVIVRSEWPMKASIAPTSATASARTSTRVSVLPGWRTSPPIAKRAAATTSDPPFLEHATVGELHGAVVAAGDVRVVGRHDEREADLLLQRVDQVKHPLARVRVELAGRLVA